MLGTILYRMWQEISEAPRAHRDLHEAHPILDGYEKEVAEAMARGEVTAADIARELDGFPAAPEPPFAFVDAASDLLRRAACGTGDAILIRRATEEHCYWLLKAADLLFDKAAGDFRGGAATDSLYLSLRARTLIDQCAEPDIDPDLRVKAYLRVGRVYAYPGSIALYLAIPPYLKAARIMKQQGWLQDYQEMMNRLISMAKYIAEATAKGAEFSLISIDRAYDVAEEAADTQLLELVALSRVRGYRAANLFEQAAQLAREALLLPGFSDSARDDVRFELAASLGGRYGQDQNQRRNRTELAEAIEILESLLKSEQWLARSPENPFVTLMNLANLFAVDGQLQAAYDRYRESFTMLLPGDEQSKILLLLQWGRLLYESDREAEGREKVLQAQELVDRLKPVSFASHFGFYASLAYAWHELGELERSSSQAALARDLYNLEIDRVVDPSMWRGGYRGFQRLDSYLLEHAIKAGGSSPAEALFCAEEAKARTFTRLRALVKPGQPVVERAERAETIRSRIEGILHSGEQAACTLISLFVGYRGLAVIVARNGEVAHKWLDDFNDDILLKQVVFPLPALLSAGFSGSSDELSAASGLIEAALAQVGEAIWRCFPAIAEGGGELLIVPHRMLRGFPIMHARLPGGKRFSEIFSSVSIVSSLDLPAVAAAAEPGQVSAVADSLGDLLLARFEALKACGSDGAIIMKSDASKERIQEALGREGTIVVASHAVFDPIDPWNSVLRGSDQDLQLFDVLAGQGPLKAELVYLSACEAGMSDIGIGDDPAGFATLFSYTGAGAVVGPLWRVDDFTALLFADAFFRARREGSSPARSTAIASGELRALSAGATLEIVGRFRDELAAMVARELIPAPEAGLIGARLDSKSGCGASIRARTPSTGSSIGGLSSVT